MAKKQKHPGGRPTKYKLEYAKQLIEYFDSQEPLREIDVNHFNPDGSIKWIDKKLVANRIPSLLKFAKSIKCGYRTIYDWIDKKHGSYQEEFSQAFTLCKQIRKELLIDMGMTGVSPPASFKFVAVNMTDMRDKQDHDVSGTVEHRIVKFGNDNSTK